MINLASTTRDDPVFRRIVSRVINDTVRRQASPLVYVVQLDGWFDHKWERFAGVVFSQVGVWLDTPLRVPPFHPNRVLSETCLQRDDSGPDYTLRDSAPLHIRQWSIHNLQRRLEDIACPGIYVWYSGNTKAAGRGSIMVYSLNNDNQAAWYASLFKSKHWQVNKVRGLSKKQVLRITGLYLAASKP